MKRLKQSQIQNLIFLGVVMLVAASVVVYLLLKGEPTTALEGEADTAVGETAAPAKERFEAAPIAVIWTHLKGDARFVLTKRSELEYEVALADGQDGISATLRLGESNGRLASMLWVFNLPTAPGEEPKNEIEKRLAEHYEAQMRGAEDCIRTILSVSFDACDLNDMLTEPTRRAWQDGALETLSGGKDYKDTTGACTFSAYVSDGSGSATLVCALLFN